MEEADAIILLTLRSASCEVPDEVKKISDFDADGTYATVRSAMTVIAGADLGLPKRLSPSVGVRHRVCSALGNLIKDAGFRGEVGYSQILYPNDRDLRRILQFLVDKLPRAEGAGGGEAASGPAARFLADARRGAQAWSAAPWRAPAKGAALADVRQSVARLDASGEGRGLLRQVGGAGRSGALAASVLRASDARVARARAQEREAARAAAAPGGAAAYRQRQAAATRSQLGQALAGGASSTLGGGGLATGGDAFGGAGGSLRAMVDRVRRRAAGGASASARGAFGRSVAVGQESWRAASGSAASAVGHAEGGEAARGGEGGAEGPAKPKTEEELEAEREAELGALERALAAAMAAREAAGRERALVVAAARAKVAALRDARESGAELEREFLLQKKALEMLPEAERHCKELEEACSATWARVALLVDEWEAHRAAIVAAIRAAKDTGRDVAERRDALLQAAAALRAQMAPLAQQVRDKEDAARSAQAELEKVPKDSASRVDYTRRILAIVDSTRRQQAEIDRVVRDIRAVQDEVAVVSAKLTRAIRDADEVMTPKPLPSPSAANPNPPAVLAAYRLLTQLREMFTELVQSVDDTAEADNLLRRLEAQTEELEARAASRNRESILRDIKALRAENDAILARLGDPAPAAAPTAADA